MKGNKVNPVIGVSLSSIFLGIVLFIISNSSSSNKEQSFSLNTLLLLLILFVLIFIAGIYFVSQFLLQKDNKKTSNENDNNPQPSPLIEQHSIKGDLVLNHKVFSNKSFSNEASYHSVTDEERKNFGKLKKISLTPQEKLIENFKPTELIKTSTATEESDSQDFQSLNANSSENSQSSQEVNHQTVDTIKKPSKFSKRRKSASLHRQIGSKREQSGLAKQTTFSDKPTPLYKNYNKDDIQWKK